MKPSTTVQWWLLGAVAVLQVSLSAPAAQAQNDKVKWEDIAGITTPVIAAPSPPNPPGTVVLNDVQTIRPGGRPWFTSKGNAEFRPVTGELQFKVRGLVLLGGAATGTTDAITQVKGTIVCNGPVILDSEPVPLSPQGDAEFHGRITPAPTCVNPIFLIRIAPGVPNSTTDPWIAAGVVRKPGVGE